MYLMAMSYLQNIESDIIILILYLKAVSCLIANALFHLVCLSHCHYTDIFLHPPPSMLMCADEGESSGSGEGHSGMGGGKDGMPRSASEASVFSNLEAIRTTLEDQLGLDTMLHAYNLIQVYCYIVCTICDRICEKEI